MNPGVKIAIVAPCHIQPSETWINNLRREAEMNGADVIIVHDSWKEPLNLPLTWRVFDYKRQEEFLGEDYEYFAKTFHKSSAIRVFGHLVAYKEGYDFIIGLDSDCDVPFNFVAKHLLPLNSAEGHHWTNPLSGSGFYTRGYPYSARDWRVVANMGVWENVLDINGADRRHGEPTKLRADFPCIATAPIPFSGMNFSITRDAVLGFLFLPNFDFPHNDPEKGAIVDEFRRIDDVWGGYIFQKLAEKRKESVTYGPPIVFHDTKVVASEDAAEEAAMYKWEDAFIKCVDLATIALDDVPKGEKKPSYPELYMRFAAEFEKYKLFPPMVEAINWWAKVTMKYA